MLAAVELGDFRSDVVGTLGTFIGSDRAGRLVTSIEDFIRLKAKEGAMTGVDQRTPELRAAIKKDVTKIVVPALVAGVAGALLGATALIISLKRRR